MKYTINPEWDQRLIDINPKGDIGIVMSGGIDSWILYNLLPPRVKIFNIKRADGFDNADTIRRLTGRNDIIEIDESTNEHSSRIGIGIQSIIYNYGLDELYCGENMIPPIQHFPEFNNASLPNRIWRNQFIVYKTPFLHLYKYHILSLAESLNISIDDCQSCLVQKIGHCGNCWQCMEISWAKSQLN